MVAYGGLLWGGGETILRLKNCFGLTQRQVCLWHRDSCTYGTETAVSVAQRQLSLCYRDACVCCTETDVFVSQTQIVFVLHRDMLF